jgi:acetolactate synthase-1/2/3 large subunit
MNSAEMATLVKYGLPVLIIVFNNRALGMLRQWQNISYNSNYYETSLDDRGPDFVKLAAAYDTAGFRVTDKSSFLEALGKSLNILAAGSPVLIETIIDKDEKTLPMLF